MRVVVQRVRSASVDVEKEGYHCGIGRGLLVLAAFTEGDGEQDLEWTAKKLAALRIFDDADGVMNLSVRDVDGEMLVVSQFTLYALTARGNRPSYVRAAKPEIAIHLGKSAGKGIFGADMKVSLVNDGPVTIIIDSKIKE